MIARSALLALLGGLVMLGTAVQTWFTLRVPGAVVDGVQLPEEVLTRSGAAVAPVAVVAGLVGLGVAVVLGLTAVAVRATPAALRVGRSVAIAGAGTAMALSVMALLADAPVGEVVLATHQAPTVETASARLLHVLGALAVVVAAVLLHRAPPDGDVGPSRTEAPSRYTVEAVRGDPVGEADEWDLAVDETDPPAPEDPS